MKTRRRPLHLLLFLAFLLIALACRAQVAPVHFDGQRAYTHVKAQCDFGPRSTGSKPLERAGDYILDELKKQGWAAGEQAFTYRGTPVRNLVGKAGKGSLLILGAHYDTRRRADQDPVDPSEPVLGANDGASGVAVLLELARCLEKDRLDHEVWLVFFDAEDNGDLDGWEWIVGSAHFAQHLDRSPQAVIIVDMIGDKDQQIYKERSSDPMLQDRLWAIAADLGYETFIPDHKWAMLDDHTPFLRKGIPAVDIIDFDYPFWHTRQDTLDKVSAESLERVGRVLEVFVEGDEVAR